MNKDTEILRLFNKYQCDKSQDNLFYLFIAAEQLVKETANRIFNKLPPSLNINKDDIVHWGKTGLADAIEHSEIFAKKNTDITPIMYLNSRISGTIMDELRRMDWQNTATDQTSSVESFVNKFIKEHRRFPTNSELLGIFPCHINDPELLLDIIFSKAIISIKQKSNDNKE